MTMPELLEESKKYGLMDEKGRSYYTEFHKRLVLPVGCLILALIGMPLGLQAGPGKKAIGIPFGLVLYILYYVLFTMGRNISITTSADIVLAMWTPNILFFLLTVLLINRAAHEKSLVPGFVHLLYATVFKFASTSVYNVYRLIVPKFDTIRNSRETDNAPNNLQKNKNIRGNVNSRVFHFPECDHYYCKNCSIEFKNVEVATQSGFEPCKFCRKFIGDLD
jgi:lipopolysaccharide export system permease protein